MVGQTREGLKKAGGGETKGIYREQSRVDKQESNWGA